MTDLSHDLIYINVAFEMDISLIFEIFHLSLSKPFKRHKQLRDNRRHCFVNRIICYFVGLLGCASTIKEETRGGMCYGG